MKGGQDPEYDLPALGGQGSPWFASRASRPGTEPSVPRSSLLHWISSWQSGGPAGRVFPRTG